MRQAFHFVLKFLICLRFINPLQASVVWKPFSVHFSNTPAIPAVDVARSGICGALHVADPPNDCFPLSAVASNETNKIKLPIGDMCAAIVYDDRDKLPKVQSFYRHIATYRLSCSTQWDWFFSEWFARACSFLILCVPKKHHSRICSCTNLLCPFGCYSDVAIHQIQWNVQHIF